MVIKGPLPLVLASTSRYRAKLLKDAGLAFEAHAPKVDERAPCFDGLAPETLSLVLARAKAAAVHRARPDAVVVGSDQVCALADRRFDQPGTVERAIATLEALSGRTHALFTSLVVLGPPNDILAEGEFAHTDVTHLAMRELDRAAIERYVELDQPLDCAGSYKLESTGAFLFESVVSQDASAIQGLPMRALGRALRGFGWNLP